MKIIEVKVKVEYDGVDIGNEEIALLALIGKIPEEKLRTCLRNLNNNEVKRLARVIHGILYNRIEDDIIEDDVDED